MPICEQSDGLATFVVDVQPSWRFRNDECEDADESREEDLEPGRQLPRGVAGEIETTTNCTTGKDRTGEPEGIAVSGKDTAPRRVCCFDDVDGTGGRYDADSETKQEATAHELVSTVRLVFNRGAGNDDT